MRILETIDKYIGKEFSSTFNCFDLVCDVYAEIGYRLPRLDPDHTPREECDKLLNKYSPEFESVSKAKAYDIIIFKSEKDIPYHAGIMIDGIRFIHCHKKYGTIINRKNDHIYKGKVEGIYRLKEREKWLN